MEARLTPLTDALVAKQNARASDPGADYEELLREDCMELEAFARQLERSNAELAGALKDMVEWVAALAYGKSANAHEEVMRSPRMAKAVIALSDVEFPG
jgi:hypothetical protein